MILVDGHCDTLKEAFKRNIDLDNNCLKFNISSKMNFPILQMMAIYISPEEAENGYEITKSVLDYYEIEKEKIGDKIIHVKSKEDNQKPMAGNYRVMLTIEKGSAIQGYFENIDYLSQ